MKTKPLAFALAILLSLSLVMADPVSIPTDQNLFAQEIYYGLLNFISHLFIPFMIIVLAIIVALMILIFLGFLKKLVDRL